MGFVGNVHALQAVISVGNVHALQAVISAGIISHEGPYTAHVLKMFFFEKSTRYFLKELFLYRELPPS